MSYAGQLMISSQAQDLISVWNRPVNPAIHPVAQIRTVPPVTREDLGHRFHTSAFKGFRLEPDTPDGRRIVGYQEDLDLYTRVYDFGDVLWPACPFVFANNFREVIDEIAQRGLYVFDIWAYCPTGTEEAMSWSEYRAPEEAHEYMLAKLGPRFVGWDNGEQDGRFVAHYAQQFCPAPVTRQQAYEGFVGYFRRLAGDLHNYLNVLAGETMLHYLADMDGTRLLGAETAQGLPSVPMWFTFIRGAGKQYGILWSGMASVFNRWGSKSYSVAEDVVESSAHGYESFSHGPYSGTSLSLLKRLWYIECMYNSCMMSFEGTPLTPLKKRRVVVNGEEREVPALSPIGEIQIEGTAWCQRHSDRGVMYTPVALVWDFYAGWLPARSLYAIYPYLVWGNMPYEKGDHQIDMLFRAFFPSYEDCSYYHDERGYLTATPCGDVFDVLLSNVSRFVLNRYNVALVIGPTRLEDQLLETIKDFIDHGGSVVTTAAQLTPQSAELFGVRLTGETHSEKYSQLSDGRGFNEPPFTRHGLELLPGTEVLATTSEGAPLVTRRRTPAGGELLLFAADYGLSDWLLPAELPSSGIAQPPISSFQQAVSLPLTFGGVDQPLASPYQLPQHVRAILLPWLEKWNLVEVDGPPIQYITNLTEAPDRFLVTLCNNEAKSWRGAVRFRDANIAGGSNWMTETAIEPGEAVWLQLGPGELVVMELRSDRPLVKFKSKDVPAPSAEELERVSDVVRQRLESQAPETALAQELPAPLAPAQSAEPAGALYVNSWLLEGMDPAEWIPVVKELELTGIEIRGTDLFDPAMPELWRRLRDAGLQIGAVNAGVDLVPYIFGGLSTKVNRRRETTLAWLARVMDIMAEAGISRLVVYPDKSDETYQTTAECREMLVASLARLGEQAGGRGLTVVVEGAPGRMFGRSQELRGVVAACDCPAVRLSLDLAHAQTEGEDPLQAFATLCKAGLDYVHFSNCRRLPNGLVLDQHLPLTEGDISTKVYPEILSQWSGEGQATCIHIVSSDQPLSYLRKAISRIRR